jgi:hypothetical protein
VPQGGLRRVLPELLVIRNYELRQLGWFSFHRPSPVPALRANHRSARGKYRPRSA